MRTSAAATSGDPVSQRDIARHFGVSHVTVSLALRDSRRVSSTLAAEIRAYADAVGYRRDPVLNALADYRRRKTRASVRGALAWINAWGHPEMLRAHPEVDRYWRGASDAALDCGFRLEEFRLGTEFTPARLHQVLETRNIRGILLPPHEPFAKWRDFPWELYAVVTLGQVAEGPAGHRVVPATTANLVLALRRIRDRGYRRIGWLAGCSVLRGAGPVRENGWPEARMVPFLDLAGVPESKVASRVGGWIRCHRLDAVLADDPATARRVMDAGFSVPGDIAVATLARAGDAGIDPGSEEIGRTGLQMLDALMRERSAAPPRLLRQVAVEGFWVDGPGLPCLADHRPLKYSPS